MSLYHTAIVFLLLCFYNTNNVNTLCSKCSCGYMGSPYRHGRIIGGQALYDGELPWLAAVVRSGRVACGATVVSPQHLVTAAHCIGSASASEISVLIGRYNVTKDRDKYSKRVGHVVRHPQFNNVTYDNDIAVLQLIQPMDEALFKPVCLPETKDTPDITGKKVMVAGWGSTEEKGAESSIPKKTFLNVLSRSNCEGSYSINKITPRMICASNKNTDACTGDSGGPLILPTPKATIVGIVSWGRGCARPDYPGVYTRVDRFLPWLKTAIRGDCLCN